MTFSRRRFLLGLPLAARALAAPGHSQKAINRGLRFIYRTSRDRRHFNDYGDDLMWCFYSIARATADAALSRTAMRMALERAKVWSREHSRLPENVDIDTLGSVAYAYIPVELMGFRNEGLKDDIRRAAARFSAIDYLGYDPRKEGVPSDVPHACGTCDRRCPRGTQICTRCGAPLRMSSRYDVLCDALLTTYNGQLLGIEFGASYPDVLCSVPAVRPYAASLKTHDGEFYPMAYCVTHIVYTLNDYTLYRLRPEWLPQEYEFLRTGLRENIEANDPETLGEFVDTLKSFGMTEEEPLLRDAIAFLLPRQNADGSWGDPKDRDIYNRYHTTWTVIGALMDYAWRGEKPVPAFLH